VWNTLATLSLFETSTVYNNATPLPFVLNQTVLRGVSSPSVSEPSMVISGTPSYVPFVFFEEIVSPLIFFALAA